MTEIEDKISTLEKLIPTIEDSLALYAYEKYALYTALQALREKAENDKLTRDYEVTPPLKSTLKGWPE